jgi:pimeloyl-ACP methyl ester carboxylesterase
MSASTLAAAPYQSVDLHAGTIRYRVAGHGPSLVFVHGLFMNGDLWRGVVAELAERYRCFVPEWPLGAHEWPMHPDADLSPPGVATLILEFIEALELHDVTLVGNDTGGALCQIAISRRPARVARLALTNCDSYESFFPPSLRAFQVLPRIPGATWLLAQALRPRVVRRAFAKSVAKRIPATPQLDVLFAPTLRCAHVRRDLRKFCTRVSSRQTLEAAKTFASYERPVLIVWGQDDWFFPQSHGRRLAESFPNARLECVDDSRTLVPEDQPVRLAALIAEFVGTYVAETQPA